MIIFPQFKQFSLIDYSLPSTCSDRTEVLMSNDKTEVKLIPWSGDECPVTGDVLVKLRNGHIYFARKPEKLDWEWFKSSWCKTDVIAYKAIGITNE